MAGPLGRRARNERDLPGGEPHRSLADFLLLLKEGIAELQQATSGSLLGNPRSFVALLALYTGTELNHFLPSCWR